VSRVGAMSSLWIPTEDDDRKAARVLSCRRTPKTPLTKGLKDSHPRATGPKFRILRQCAEFGIDGGEIPALLAATSEINHFTFSLVFGPHDSGAAPAYACTTKGTTSCRTNGWPPLHDHQLISYPDLTRADDLSVDTHDVVAVMAY
jgi:hypothetical protein